MHEGWRKSKEGSHARLQDEINTILCKRARLIALGKAYGISGIPNKLTLNVEGSPSMVFSIVQRLCMGRGRKRICMYAIGYGRNTPYTNIT